MLDRRTKVLIITRNPSDLDAEIRDFATNEIMQMSEAYSANESVKPIELLSGKKAVIFDWDDTITPSFLFWSPLIADFIESEGYEKPDTQTLRGVWGRPLREIFAHLIIDTDPDIIERYGAFVPEDLEMSPIEGASETLHQLRNSGYTLGIVSSSSRRHLNRCLGASIPSELFKFIVSLEDSMYTKPHPGVFDAPFELLTSHGIQRDEIVYVGDSLGDYQAARAAGIDFIGVATGVVTTEEFIEAGIKPHYVLGTVKDLFEWS